MNDFINVAANLIIIAFTIFNVVIVKSKRVRQWLTSKYTDMILGDELDAGLL